jgi:hypothetical protein
VVVDEEDLTCLEGLIQGPGECDGELGARTAIRMRIGHKGEDSGVSVLRLSVILKA